MSYHTTNTSRKANSETRKRKQKFGPLNLNIISSPKTRTRFYIIKVRVENKRSIDPFTLEDQIANLTGSKPKSIATSGQESFSGEISSEVQEQKLLNVKKIGDFPSVESRNEYLNRSKGLIYISDFLDTLLEREWTPEYIHTKISHFIAITGNSMVTARTDAI